MKRSFAIAISIYIGFAAMPLSWWWYAPGEVFIYDADEGDVPALRFSRDIYRQTVMQYSVIIRGRDGLSACESHSGLFPYQERHGPIVGRDLEWWAPGCGTLPAGAYTMSTTWTAPQPLAALLPKPAPVDPEATPDIWTRVGNSVKIGLRDGVGWLLPPKRVTRESSFVIRPKG
jgi:hypothetical protein